MELVEAEAIYDAGREVVVGVLLRMDAQIQALTARVARQDERIEQLERRLNRSSRNSSVPPSADPLAGTPKRGKDSSGRKQGAQPGHEGNGRSLLPAWAVDQVIEVARSSSRVVSCASVALRSPPCSALSTGRPVAQRTWLQRGLSCARCSR